MENVENVYALTPMQEGMLFHTISAPDSGVFVEQICFSIRGALDVDRLKAAWAQTVERHAALRTIFLWDGLDEPLQVVRQKVEVPWVEKDWRGPDALPDQLLREYLSADRHRGIDLSAAPLMRMTLIRFSDDHWRLIWTHHHLLSDGWSTPLVLQEVMKAYAGVEQQKPSFEYQDYVAYLQNQTLSSAEMHWRELLAGFSEPTRVENPLSPFDGDPASSSASAAQPGQQRRILSTRFSTKLKAFARQHRLTLNTVFLGAWARLLHAHTREKDIVFGTTVSGRPAELDGIESAIGMFINTLPIRIKLDDQRLVDWLREIQTQQLILRQYEYSPLASVQSWSDIPRGQALFESIVVFENYPEPTADGLELPGITVGDFDYVEQSNYPIALLVVPQDEIEVFLVHQTDRYSNRSPKAFCNN